MPDFDSVDTTLLTTQNLLCSLEQDGSLLHDIAFMDKLTSLRLIHRDTADALFNRLRGQSCHNLSTATYHASPGCTHFWSDLPIASTAPELHAHHSSCHVHPAPIEEHRYPTRPSTSYATEDIRHVRQRPIVRDAADIIKQRQMITTRRRYSQRLLDKKDQEKPEKPVEKEHTEQFPTPSKQETSQVKIKTRLDRQKSNSVADVRSVRKESAKPPPSKVTVPKPFNLSTRKTKGNTYAQKFLQKMLDDKEKEKKEIEENDSKREMFKAHPVPKTTYETTNPLVKDDKYAEAIRKKLQANFQLRTTLIRSKSTGDITTHRVRPVPATTYISPLYPNYLRGKSASQRAVNLLGRARSPTNMQEHSIRTNVAFQLRHAHCRQPSPSTRIERPPVPDFRLIHEKLNIKLQQGSAKHQPTVPLPFNLSEPSARRHRQCLSRSPPKYRASPNFVSPEVSLPIRATTASVLREKATKALIEKHHESEAHWRSKREQSDFQREQLQKALQAKKSTEEDIQTKVREKISALRERTQEYKEHLAEMNRRVLARPLVMEQQNALAQKHRLEKKFSERMAAASAKKTKQIRLPEDQSRRESDVSATGTFTVHEKEGSSQYSADFDSSSTHSSSSRISSSKSPSKESSTSHSSK